MAEKKKGRRAGPAGGSTAGSSSRKQAAPAARTTVNADASTVVPAEGGAVVRSEAAAVVRAEGAAVNRLLAGRHHNPHSILGAHPAPNGVVIRAMHHAAQRAEVVLPDGDVHEMSRVHGGLFAVFLAGYELPLRYRIR